MPPVFGPKTNPLSWFSLLLVVVAGGALFIGADQIQKSPYTTQVKEIVTQPVPFPHKHHVQGLGIDCRFCHVTVEKTRYAGIPPTSTCMTCHSQVWTEAPMLQPVRDSYKENKPIPWVRIHDLPDFVYFDHSIHVKRGVGCTSCHGRVDEMPITWKAETLYMGWCLECHKHPEQALRPQNEVFKMDWKPRADQATWGAERVKELGIERNINCSTCHR